ncbi:MAG: hypothetical protein K0B00_05415 [Rhodobacteraceae bacterium]|nr:hypothetical protein [Paracoccaceae bacterium]
MTDAQILLNLPLETLVVLVCGYLGYRIAYTGKDASHSAVDVVFMSLAFSLVAKGGLVLGNLTAAGLGFPAAVMCALLAASLWRSSGERLTRQALRWANISNSDRTQTAWERISTDASLRPSQLIVRRRDGRLLMCERLADFEKEPLGPCIYGSDGSVALFVTHERGPEDADWVETPDPADDRWGRLIACIPAAEIAAIYLRHPTLT